MSACTNTEHSQNLGLTRDTLVAHYRHQKSLLTSTLLSRLTPSNVSSHPKLHSKVEKHQRQSLENAYRLGAGITSFHVRDPDPNAVDSGRILGIKIEVFNPRQQTYEKPYYLFLNRPDGEQGPMRVHKHTVPPYVGLKGIAGRYMAWGGDDAAQRQDIVRFARAVRRELVAATKRRCAMERLHDEAETCAALDDVKAKDLEAREMEISWRDGAVGRVKVGKEGDIEGVCVVAASEDRAKPAVRLRRRERAIKGENVRIEGIVQRLSKEW